LQHKIHGITLPTFLILPKVYKSQLLKQQRMEIVIYTFVVMIDQHVLFMITSQLEMKNNLQSQSLMSTKTLSKLVFFIIFLYIFFIFNFFFFFFFSYFILFFFIFLFFLNFEVFLDTVSVLIGLKLSKILTVLLDVQDMEFVLMENVFVTQDSLALIVLQVIQDFFSFIFFRLNTKI